MNRMVYTELQAFDKEVPTEKPTFPPLPKPYKRDNLIEGHIPTLHNRAYGALQPKGDNH